MRRSAARGFTLVEAMLAIGLIVILVGAMFAFLWDLTVDADDMERVAVDSQGANAVIEQIESDLFCAVAGAGGGAGVRGTGSGLLVLSRGVMVPVGDSEADGKPGDLQGSEFTFDRLSGEIRARRWKGAGAGSGAPEVACDHVQRLRLRYYDGRRWVGEFDSRAEGRLPAAIEVALWFGPVLEPADGAFEPVVEFPMDEDSSSGAMAEPGIPVWPKGEPDRRRVIVVPDGPVAAWRDDG